MAIERTARPSPGGPLTEDDYYPAEEPREAGRERPKLPPFPPPEPRAEVPSDETLAEAPEIVAERRRQYGLERLSPHDRQLPSLLLDAQRQFLYQAKQENPYGARVLQDLRGWLSRLLWRHLVRHLAARRHFATFLVFGMVLERTLGWGKLLELIPADQLCEGMLDRDHPAPAEARLRVDDGGLPILAGSDMDHETARLALRDLVNAGLLTSFPVPRRNLRPAHAYMPLTPAAWLEILAEAPRTRQRDRGIIAYTADPDVHWGDADEAIAAVQGLAGYPGVVHHEPAHPDIDVAGMYTGRVRPSLCTIRSRTRRRAQAAPGGRRRDRAACGPPVSARAGDENGGDAT
jgi:hypothetical protein